MADTVLGLDLSLRGAGMVAVPSDWAGDWSRIARVTVGHALKKDASEADRIGRLVHISAEVVAFAEAHRCTRAAIEQYAFTSRNAHSHSLGELGGVVKVLLTERCRIPLVVVPPASGRKLILGRLPRADVKIHTRAALTRMGTPVEWTDDEADAFVCANHWLAGNGGYALVVPEAGAPLARSEEPEGECPNSADRERGEQVSAHEKHRRAERERRPADEHGGHEKHPQGRNGHEGSLAGGAAR